MTMILLAGNILILMINICFICLNKHEEEFE